MRWGRAACIPGSLDCLLKFRYRIVGSYSLVDLPVLSAGFNEIQAHFLQATILELQHLSGAIGKVDNAARYDRAAVVHLHHHRSSVPQVSDPYVASQRKRWMSRRHVVHIEVFAAGGRFTDEILPIP